MSIRKRYKKDGSYVWEFCITICKNPRKQYRKSGFKKKEQAQLAEAEMLEKIKNGYNTIPYKGCKIRFKLFFKNC